jgi:hypothetical protein
VTKDERTAGCLSPNGKRPSHDTRSSRQAAVASRGALDGGGGHTPSPPSLSVFAWAPPGCTPIAVATPDGGWTLAVLAAGEAIAACPLGQTWTVNWTAQAWLHVCCRAWDHYYSNVSLFPPRPEKNP